MTELIQGRPHAAQATPTAASPAEQERVVSQLRQAIARGEAAAAEALAGIHGDFALALSDAASGRTLLAVDRFAMRTLCYSVEGGTLRFAERADALAGAGDALDLQALYDYLYFHCIPAPRTVFKGVQRLPAGHYAWFEGGRLAVKPYWRARFDEPARGASFESLKTEFRNLLRGSVARQLDGGKAACFLSGGTDSSTVAGMIGEVTGKPAASYSIGFEAEGYDEMEYARIAARRFGTEHHEYYITPADLVSAIPQAAAHHDQPFGNSSSLPAYYCALKARGDGATRMLAGDGGDELFGGNTRYAKQRVFSWYDDVPAALRGALLEPMAGASWPDRLPLVRKAASYVRQARVPMPDRTETYNLLHRLEGEDMFTPAFTAAVNAAAPIEQQRAVWAESAGASFVNRMLAFDWRYTLAENDLVKVRGSTELAGVGVGYPFLDQALVDFSARLPTSYKLKGLKLRWFFKEALRGFLPDEIITKKKHGFGLPFGPWATRDPALKALARDLVRALGERGLIRQAFADRLVDHYLPQHPGYYGEMVWILMMLEQWLRGHRGGFRL